MLGPLSQSITAANLLGGFAQAILDRHAGIGVVYGVPDWGFTVLWAALAAAITSCGTRAPAVLTDLVVLQLLGRHLHHGTAGLALHAGSAMFHLAAVAF